ncbi:MAG: cell wall-binding repeat-containing protein [Gracilibacteraceae bacterium]|jgi:exopolysaccharide biosynthesis protein|nr:cell wall-binding repeat-containing protein [Gracilibacteraceae bacterium]
MRGSGLILKILKASLLGAVMSAALSTAVFATSHPAVSYEEKQVNGVNLKIVVVNQTDPGIGLKVTLTDNTLGATKAFSEIVAQEKAIVSINGNFFEAYQDYKVPLGNVMAGGELLYGAAGMPGMGITAENELVFGLPNYFAHVKTIPRYDGEAAFDFVAADVNLAFPRSSLQRLYTPAYGKTFEALMAGTAYVFENNAFASYRRAAAGEQVAIPAAGYVVYYSENAPARSAPSDPDILIGCGAAVEYRLNYPEAETAADFGAKKITSILTGNARLIKNGSTADATAVDATDENDPRWTEAAPRTAIGELADGRLLIVSTPSARLEALAEAMASLGCVNAINLDGGGSVSMAVDGKVKASGRALTVTFHVVEKSRTAPASGGVSAAAPETPASAPESAPARDPRFTYISGQNRVETSVAISRQGWTSAETVILAPGGQNNLIDALAVAPLAGQEKAPILLSTGSLDPAVVAEIQRLGAKKVYAVGAISSAVIDALKAALPEVTVEVLKGSNRFETAALINAKLTAPQGTFVVGYNAIADAVSVASFAAANGYAIQIANPNGSVSAAPTGTAYILGGLTLVSDVTGATRLYGATRYETNKAIRDALTFEYTNIYTADGGTLVDALTGSALAAQTRAAIVLLPGNNSTGTDFGEITQETKIYAFGG